MCIDVGRRQFFGSRIRIKTDLVCLWYQQKYHKNIHVPLRSDWLIAHMKIVD